MEPEGRDKGWRALGGLPGREDTGVGVLMDEEEFARELEKGIPGRGTACATAAGERGPGASSPIPAALWGWSTGGSCRCVWLFAPRRPDQPLKGETKSLPAADVPLTFVV